MAPFSGMRPSGQGCDFDDEEVIEYKEADPEDEEPPPPLVPAGPPSEDQDLRPFADVPDWKWLAGEVHHTASFGVYVRVPPPEHGPRRWGLVHTSELPDEDRGLVSEALDEAYPPGKQVQVRVLLADAKHCQLALSMRPQGARRRHSPRAVLKAQPASRWLTGSVAAAAPYGIFVNLPALETADGEADEGGCASGLVYATELDDVYEDLPLAFPVGKSVEVRVLGEDAAAEKLLLLSMKTGHQDIELDVQAKAPPPPPPTADAPPEVAAATAAPSPSLEMLWASGALGAGRRGRGKAEELASFLDVDPSVWLVGMVRLSSFKGAFVEVAHPEENTRAQGFVPGAELGDADTDPADALRMGQQVRVRIAEVDMRKKRLELTMRRLAE